MSNTTPPFSDYTDLLQTVLTCRNDIVRAIDRLLNCQKKSLEYQQDLDLQSRLFMECFLGLPQLTQEQLAIADMLEEARWESGLKPRDNPGNDIVDPVQMMLRAFYLWQQTRWPGQKGRQHYAHTLFNLSLIRCLTLLSLRLWDEPPGDADTRLLALQALLDHLWQGSPDTQPRLVRDVRWLIPVALSPTTDDLSGYFKVAAAIAEYFPEQDRIETQRAWVQTGAGHLSSQLRHLCVEQAVSIDEPDLVLLTRKSNALDICLLMEGLVTLFKAYESGDEQQRQTLAAVICHGVSADPELFLLRLDLLGPYTMIEHIFISTEGDGEPQYTVAGLRHLALLREYEALLERLAQPLYENSLKCRPVEGGYSAYGVLYGFSSNLLELMAFKTLQAGPTPSFSMEDIFTQGTADKRDWVNNWRKLPHIQPEVTRQFEYAEDFAQALHERVEKAFQCIASSTTRVPEEKATIKSGQLFILPESAEQADGTMEKMPELASRYVVASDQQLVEANKAEHQNEGDLLHCRLEGEFLVSYKTSQGWLGITKDMLTEVLGTGKEVKITGLPTQAAQVLGLMCPNLTTSTRSSKV